MVNKAAKYLTAYGTDKAFKEFDDSTGQFVKRDLYIYVLDFKGRCLSHGANRKLVGHNLLDLKDADGKLFIREIISIIGSEGRGWVDYLWSNPTNKRMEQKSVFFEKVGDLVVACGFYK